MFEAVFSRRSSRSLHIEEIEVLQIGLLHLKRMTESLGKSRSSLEAEWYLYVALSHALVSVYVHGCELGWFQRRDARHRCHAYRMPTVKRATAFEVHDPLHP